MASAEKIFTIDKDFQTSVREGQAEVLFRGAQDVFYNPVQEFNRDLSVAVLRLYAQNYLGDDSLDKEKEFPDVGKVYENGITILEALAASGLRSIRYAKEVGGIKNIVANDISTAAVNSIKDNVKHNNVDHLVSPNEGDALTVMYQHRQKSKFAVVDLDPYGSPSPFIDAAVQCVDDNGLLMVTATDMAILCGNLPESCFAKYGAISLRNKACHEIALRIILQAIQTSAVRYGRYIEPLLSVSVDFYVRLFMLVHSGKNECRSSASNLSMVYQCVHCHMLAWQKLMNKNGEKFVRAHGPPVATSCEYCHGRLNFGGPLWIGPIHHQDFINSLLTSLDNKELGELKTHDRIYGVLSVISEELVDVPLYYGLDHLASFLKLSCPSSVQFRSAILNAGYRVSFSHCYKQSIKTDAPPTLLWDIFRCLAQIQHPTKVWPRPLPDHPSPADYILSKSVSSEINLNLHPDANPDSRKKKLVRFQNNPEKNWGPKARAKSSVLKNVQVEKRQRNQNKKRRIETVS